MTRTIPAAFRRGYVLCSPAGKLEPKTYRRTKDDAIAVRFRAKDTRAERWEKAEKRGWSVQLVYVRFFVPVFKATYSTTEIDEVCE